MASDRLQSERPRRDAMADRAARKAGAMGHTGAGTATEPVTHPEKSRGKGFFGRPKTGGRGPKGRSG
jgi:hypothetical protein